MLILMPLIPALSHAEIPKQIPKHLLKYQLKWRNSKKLSLKIRILYVVDKFLTFQIIYFFWKASKTEDLVKYYSLMKIFDLHFT